MQDYHYPPNCRGIDEFQWKQRERSGPRLSYPGNKAAKNAEICPHWVPHSWYFLSISAVIWLSLQPTAQQGGNPVEKQQGLTELPTLKGILQLSLLQGGKEQLVKRLIVSMVRYFTPPSSVQYREMSLVLIHTKDKKEISERHECTASEHTPAQHDAWRKSSQERQRPLKAAVILHHFFITSIF